MEVWANDATGSVTSGGTTAPSAGTVETWTVSVSAAFPVASATAAPPTWFYAVDPASETEKVLVTSAPGGTGSQTWTVTRGADGTTPLTHVSGFTVRNVITRAGLQGVQRSGLPLYYWNDFGIKADGGTTDNGPLINAALRYMWNGGSGQGGMLVLPQCGFMAGGNTAVEVYSPVVIPPYCGIVGMGMQKTMIRLGVSCNCDVIQFMRVASQTTLSAAISGTITSIPVAALPAAIPPGGSVQVVNGSSATQTFTVTSAGAAAGATSIPVTSTLVTITTASGNAVYDATQSVIMGVTLASSMQNCYYGVLAGLTVHGTYNYQASTDYHSCVNMTTYPATSAASGDPDFDPFNLLYDVECRYASGDGFSHTGRGGLRVRDCLFRYNQGNGVTASFDSLYYGCDFGFNGVAGLYLNHGSTNGAACKSYNNGNIPYWVSGTSYSATAGSWSRVLYNGVVYGCILAVSGSTPPSSDATHWTAIGAYTSPAAYGWDYYFDTNAYEACWSGCDSQEPTVGSYYLKGATGCNITGVSNRPNWDNPTTGAQLSSNPNSYGTCAAVVLDDANGCNVSVGYNAFNSAAYVLRAINSTTRCNVIAAGDNTQQALTDASTSLAGNFAVINGAVQSPLVMAQSADTGVVAVTYAATVTLNAQLGGHFRVTLTGNVTFAAPSNPVDGQKITMEVIQDSTGSRTATWNAAFDWGAGGTVALSTAANARDLLGWVYSGSSSKWITAGVTKGA